MTQEQDKFPTEEQLPRDQRWLAPLVARTEEVKRETEKLQAENERLRQEGDELARQEAELRKESARRELARLLAEQGHRELVLQNFTDIFLRLGAIEAKLSELLSRGNQP